MFRVGLPSSLPFAEMQRAARGLDVPQGTAGQEQAALKCFSEFLSLGNMDEDSLNSIAKSLSAPGALRSQNFYSLLTAFCIYLQTKTSARGAPLAKATAVGYLSQVVNLLRERYPTHLSDNKRIAKIREKMAAAIDERNIVAGVQTGEAPGCTLSDLCVLVQETAITGVGGGFKSLHDSAVLTLMWHTFGRAIDTCFARKSQLSMAASGELFLHIARIKTSVVQGVSIYKAAVHWEQCMLHALGMLFVGASEPSCYVFPLVPHAATPDLPGGKTYSQDEAIMYWEELEQSVASKEAEPKPKRVRGRPNVSKYINDVITVISDRVAKACAPQAPSLTTGLSSHSLRRGSAAYANACPQLAIQWISTRGAWLLDSLTKAFAYVGTTTREDQSVGKVLAGYKDPHLPCSTPSISALSELLPAADHARLLVLRGQLFKNVSGFTDTSLNVDKMVLDAALASLLIHLDEFSAAAAKKQAVTGYTSHYMYRFHEALDATNAALGCNLTLTTCIDWGQQLKTAWEIDNFSQIGAVSGGDTTVLTAAITQMLASIASMQRTLAKLVSIQEQRPRETASSTVACQNVATPAPPRAGDIVVDAHSLAGCLYNWYTMQLWHTATHKKQQFARAELKACVNIMIVVAGRNVDVPVAPLDRDGVSFQLWKQTLWSLAEDLDKNTNSVLSSLDRKGRCKTAGSLRKRWRNLRKEHRSEYDALCSAYLARRANGEIVDHFTPESHQWKSKDLE